MCLVRKPIDSFSDRKPRKKLHPAETTMLLIQLFWGIAACVVLVGQFLEDQTKWTITGHLIGTTICIAQILITRWAVRSLLDKK